MWCGAPNRSGDRSNKPNVLIPEEAELLFIFSSPAITGKEIHCCNIGSKRGISVLVLCYPITVSIVFFSMFTPGSLQCAPLSKHKKGKDLNSSFLLSVRGFNLRIGLKRRPHYTLAPASGRQGPDADGKNIEAFPVRFAAP